MKWLLLIAAYILLVFSPAIFRGQLPIPADTIVGMYYPWYERIPVKNPLITDAVRQTYPWRFLSVSQLQKGRMPLWNPYAFSGYPLMANLQSAPFYPLNIFFWLTDFAQAWSLQVVLQVILGGAFMALFLKNLKLRNEAVALGALAWVGSGFFVSWLESNVPVQTALWLPLALWAIDKRKGLILALALSFSLLAGHLQIAVYVFAASLAYALYRRYYISIFYLLSSIFICAWWLVPAGQFILLSNRGADQAVWQKPDWFLPWQNLAQFLAPDFFGNPATGNYFGVWNYMEFVGYIGIIPLVFALSAVRKNLYWSIFLLVALVFALPTVLAKVPFALQIPFISSAQPSRLIVLVDFALAVLAAIGADHYLSAKKIPMRFILIPGAILCLLWLSAGYFQLNISLRNLYLPTLIFVLAAIFLKRNLMFLLVLLALFDNSRFATKFLAFSPPEYLYPKSEVTAFLRQNLGYYRFAAVDDRIMPPNFSVMYGLQSIDGYDPLYLKSYTSLVPVSNRIAVPKDYNSPIFDELGVKYILSLDDINSAKYVKVFEDNLTKVYENRQVKSRVFFDNGGQAGITSYLPDEVVITTDNPQPGNLTLTDMYYPGWKVEVDGQKAAIQDVTFRQVAVPAGKHLVRFYL